jgi:hypothetical protein
MKTTSVIVFLLCSFSLLFTCSKAPGPDNTPESFNVENERIFLAPVIFKESLEKLKGWPLNPTEQKVLTSNFLEIRDKLDSEFRRCEKYGLYKMVGENESATIKITLSITSIDLKDNTLKMPIELQAKWLINGQSYILPFSAGASVEIDPQEINENRFHYLGLLLSSYTVNFPYKLIVSYFYPHK